MRSIHDWLQASETPVDFYQLLGRPKFDPDCEQLLRAIRDASRHLQPYENHADEKVARRATELVWELGRALETFIDPKKLRPYQAQMLRAMSEDWDKQKVADAQSDANLRAWLSDKQQVHSDMLDVVQDAFRNGNIDSCIERFAQATAPALDLSEEPPNPGLDARKAVPRDANRSGQPSHPATTGAPWVELEPPVEDEPPPRQRMDAPDDRLANGSRESIVQLEELWTWRRVALLVFGAITVAVIAAGLVLFVGRFQFGDAPDSAGAAVAPVPGSAVRWRGRLEHIVVWDAPVSRVHLLIRFVDGETEMPQPRLFEAIVERSDFALAVADYICASENVAQADNVIVEGVWLERENLDPRIINDPRVPLVRLASVQATRDHASRTVSGQFHDPAIANLPPGAGEQITALRRVGHRRKISAVFRSLHARGASIGVRVEYLDRNFEILFPADKRQVLFAYKPGDCVEVEAVTTKMYAGRHNYARTLRGISLVIPGDASSAVEGEGAADQDAPASP